MVDTAMTSNNDFLSEQIADALRHGELKDFNTTSAYAACLHPLLKSLGWRDFNRNLVEALPHFAKTLDLIDLRNILVSLGYDSSPVETSTHKIKEELFPCLFEADNEVLVILERNENKTSWYDATKQQYFRGRLPKLKGTAYLFTDTHQTHGLAKLHKENHNWAFRLASRFRPLIIHLLTMTGLINLITLFVPLFIMVVYDKVIGTHSTESLPYLLAGIVILLLADLVLRNIRARLMGRIAGRLDYLIGVETFQQLLSLPPLYTEKSTVASQLSRLKQFDTLRDFFTGSNASTLLELPFIILFIVVIATLSGPIAFIPVVMIAAYFLFGLFWLPHLKEQVFEAGVARTDKQRVLMQTLTGRQEIKAIGGESVWWERFREISGEAVTANNNTYMANAVMTTVAQAFMTIAGLAVVAVGADAVMQQELTIGALIAIMALVWRVLTPLQNLFLSITKIEQGIKSVQQITQLMKIKPERASGHSGLLLEKLQGHIKVDRVSFRYGPDQDPALLGVSLEVMPGESISIVGNTGSGKSTLLKLIAGMYRPQAGTFTIDDLDIRQLNAIDWRRAIAYVPQETKMFHGTIAQNLRLNNPLASDEMLRKAADEAGILQDIDNLPEGFNSRMGDANTDLMPPGFIRALSMTRAFVSPGQIVLLDEPGASLDDEADAKFQQQMENLKGKKTVIMVSHRPSHIRMTDKAILLEQGVVEFIGSPDEAVTRMLENAK